MSSKRMLAWLIAFGLGLPSAACFDVDGFVHNPVHCSTVGTATCEEKADVWDKVCLACDEPYDFAREYPWMPSTLAEGQELIPLDADTVERFRIETLDGEGTLDAYLLPAFAGSASADTTVLYNHGNYAGIEHYIPRIRFLHQTGFNVIAWDYRGYGKSLPETAPSPEQFLSDARQILEWAETVAPNPDKVIVYANSLGGVPTAEMAVHRPPCAVIWEAGFTSMSAISQANSTLSMGETFLSSGHYNNIEKIGGYPGPLFGMVGDADVKFPVEDIQRLVDNAPGPTELWVLPGVNHGIANGGVPEAGLTEYLQRIQAFLESTAPSCL